MKSIPICAIALTLLLGHATSSMATPPSPKRISQNRDNFRHSTADLVKARNLARQKIETLNGGLNRYRAEAAMHGPIRNAPFTENDDGTITFKFVGGQPAYTTPTVESVVTINPQNWDIKVDYNGPVR